MKGIPIYRIVAVQLFGILTFVILYYGQKFLIPFAFAVLFAMLMLPVCRKLERWHISRIPAILLCILLLLLFIAGLFFIVGAQAASLSKDLPQIQTKLQALVETGQRWIEQQFGVAPQEQITFVKSQISKVSSSANKFATGLVASGFGLLSGFVLMLLYFFFLLWKREKYEEFFVRFAAPENKIEVRKELNQITEVASQYLIARMLSMLFLAIIYAVGFSIIGLKNAILIALVAVIPTIIPYIGAFVGGFFPLVMALITGSPGVFLPVVAVLVVAQVLDNNIIEPLVEGQSLNLSPIFTIIAIVIGEHIWGVAGMVLFIPLFAIARIICEHIPSLHPYSFLLQNDVEDPEWIEKIKNWVKGLKKKAG